MLPGGGGVTSQKIAHRTVGVVDKQRSSAVLFTTVEGGYDMSLKAQVLPRGLGMAPRSLGLTLGRWKGPGAQRVLPCPGVPPLLAAQAAALHLFFLCICRVTTLFACQRRVVLTHLCPIAGLDVPLPPRLCLTDHGRSNSSGIHRDKPVALCIAPRL